MNKLKYFYTFSQMGSLKEAAEVLHISQPALSKAIKVLEEEFGQELTIPQGRGVVLTEAGKTLANKAKRLIIDYDSLFEADQTLFRPIRIGTFEVFSTYFMGYFLDTKYPDEQIELIELIPGEIEKAILEQKIDVGLTYIPIPNSELDFLKIGEAKFSIYGHHSFRTKPFEELPFVVPNSPLGLTPNQAKGLDGWPDHKVTRTIKYSCTMLETALDLTRRGMAVGHFPSMVVELHNQFVKSKYQLHEIDYPKKIKNLNQPIYIVKRKSLEENALIKKLSSALRKFL